MYCYGVYGRSSGTIVMEKDAPDQTYLHEFGHSRGLPLGYIPERYDSPNYVMYLQFVGPGDSFDLSEADELE